MHTGWIKYFSDGTLLEGSSESVRLKQVSWRNTRLFGMNSAEYYFNNKRILSVRGIGEYWQSEDFEVDFAESTPRLVTLRLQKMINYNDRFVSYFMDSGCLQVDFLHEGYRSPHIIPINAIDRNKWYTTEYHIDAGWYKYYISDNRI